MNDHDQRGWYAPLPPGCAASNPAASPSHEGQPDVDRSARVVGLGAVCDVNRTADDGRWVSYSVSEFALLDTGQRVVLRDLGFTYGNGVSGMAEAWKYDTVESITQDVLNVVLPDDDDSGEDHPWEWLAELAHDRGLSVTAEDLRSLPYKVELTDRVLRLLSTA